MLDFECAKTKSIALEAAWIQLGAPMVPNLALLDSAAISGRALSMKLEQPTLVDHQFRQIEERMPLRRALGQSSIAHPLVSKKLSTT